MRYMKRMIAAAGCAALILAAAGCGSKEKTPSADEGSKTVTSVITFVPEQEDTSKEALAFLKGQVPLFAKYLETRRTIPLTFETNVESDGATLHAGVYIKDEKTAAVSSTDKDGNLTRVVYKNNMAYEVNDADKTVYFAEYPEKNAKELVKSYSIQISLSDVQKCLYSTGDEELNGVSYKRETIYDPSSEQPTLYFFDEKTEKLRYIKVGDTINEVALISNSVDDKMFDVPSDYKTVDLVEEVNKKLQEEKEKDAAAANG